MLNLGECSHKKVFKRTNKEKSLVSAPLLRRLGSSRSSFGRSVLPLCNEFFELLHDSARRFIRKHRVSLRAPAERCWRSWFFEDKL